MNQKNEHRLKITETAIVRSGVIRKKVEVVYAGMISESVYSLAIIWTYGHNSMAYNLFLQKNQTHIDIPKGKLDILFISKDEIHFRFEEK